MLVGLRDDVQRTTTTRASKQGYCKCKTIYGKVKDSSSGQGMFVERREGERVREEWINRKSEKSL